MSKLSQLSLRLSLAEMFPKIAVLRRSHWDVLERNLTDRNLIRQFVYLILQSYLLSCCWNFIEERFLYGKPMMSSSTKTAETIDLKLYTYIQNRLQHYRMYAFFPILSYSFFIAIVSRGFKEINQKQITRKKYLERKKARIPFCLLLGSLHFTNKKLTTMLFGQKLIKQKNSFWPNFYPHFQNSRKASEDKVLIIALFAHPPEKPFVYFNL